MVNNALVSYMNKFQIRYEATFLDDLCLVYDAHFCSINMIIKCNSVVCLWDEVCVWPNMKSGRKVMLIESVYFQKKLKASNPILGRILCFLCQHVPAQYTG